MKDEEMAEEYLQSIEGDDCIIITDREERKQAFLAGLKAGRPQWHDLRENPNDLPKDDMSEVAIITPLGEWEKGVFRRVDCKCYWRILGFNENVKVIAWYELPTFDKE